MKFDAIKSEVLETCITLADRGYLAGTGGNVALRADDGHFAVTPSASDYYTMAPEDICIVRLSDGVQVEGAKPPSVEAGLHARVLKAQPACNASIHTHQPVASAYTLLAAPLRVESIARRALFGEAIPCVGYAPSGTGVLAWRVGRMFKKGNLACLMRNHGVVCAGKDAADAVLRVAELEAAAADYFRNAALDNKSPAASNLRQLVAETLSTN